MMREMGPMGTGETMGNYRSSVLETPTKPDEFLNIVLLGEGSAGKTTMTVRVKEGKFIE